MPCAAARAPTVTWCKALIPDHSYTMTKRKRITDTSRLLPSSSVPQVIANQFAPMIMESLHAGPISCISLGSLSQDPLDQDLSSEIELEPNTQMHECEHMLEGQSFGTSECSAGSEISQPTNPLILNKTERCFGSSKNARQ